MTSAGARRTSALIAAGSATSLLLFGLAGTASATSQNGKAAVSQGPNAAALKHMSVFGPTPSGTPETVSFVLEPRNLGRLKAEVTHGMPHGYLSVRQFAGQYGQTRLAIRALEKYLAGYGIKSTAYADGLNVNTTGTAGEYDSALSVHQNNYRIPAQTPSNANGFVGHPAMTVHGTENTPLLPRRIARTVLAVLGLTNYPAYQTSAVHKLPLARNQKPSALQTGTLTPTDFARQYHLTPISRRATGRGQTIGIVTLASLNPADPQYFWHSILNIGTKPHRITLDNVDGGSGPVSDASGSGETTLDVEQSGALAPQANIRVYQAPNNDPGFTDAFYTAASQNVAGTVSCSWGESETVVQAVINAGQEDPNYVQAFDDVFLEMDAQGQSSFVASGDSGAYAPSADLGTTNLATSVPDSSPWTTSAGGTTLAGTIPLSSTVSAKVTAQRAWGWDWLWPYYSLFTDPATGQPFTSEAAFAESVGISGSGGGYSVDAATPAYQQQLRGGVGHFSAVEYLTPTTYQAIDGLNLPTAWNFNATPMVSHGFSTGRATPDVSANADPFTGYLLYFPEFSSGGALQPGWGGTSFVAPQLNGATALIDSYLHRRVGFWNPAVYQFANQRNSPFTPLDATSTSNDNLYYSGTHGKRFNPGSGLGTPDFARLAADFARRG